MMMQHCYPKYVKTTANYINRDIISPINWWLTCCYPNGKYQDGDSEDVPDFKKMNSCAIHLVDQQNRKVFERHAVKNFEKHILRHLINTQ